MESYSINPEDGLSKRYPPLESPKKLHMNYPVVQSVWSTLSDSRPHCSHTFHYMCLSNCSVFRYFFIVPSFCFGLRSIIINIPSPPFELLFFPLPFHYISLDTSHLFQCGCGRYGQVHEAYQTTTHLYAGDEADSNCSVRHHWWERRRIISATNSISSRQ